MPSTMTSYSFAISSMMHDGDYPSVTECECVVERGGEEGLREKKKEERSKRSGMKLERGAKKVAGFGEGMKASVKVNP